MKIIKKTNHSEAGLILEGFSGEPKIFIRALGNALSGVVGTDYEMDIHRYKNFVLKREQFSKTYSVKGGGEGHYYENRAEALEKFTKLLKACKEDLQAEISLDREDTACYQGIDTVSNT